MILIHFYGVIAYILVLFNNTYYVGVKTKHLNDVGLHAGWRPCHTQGQGQGNRNRWGYSSRQINITELFNENTHVRL